MSSIYIQKEWFMATWSLTFVFYCLHFCSRRLTLNIQNILLSLDEPPIVKVADFGVSRLVQGGDPPPVSHKTFYYNLTLRTNTSVKDGHADEEFLAPEVSSRNGRFILSVKSDSWSLGVTIFYMQVQSSFLYLPHTLTYQHRLMGFSPFPEKDCLTQVYDLHRKRVDWTRVNGGSSEGNS